jgi:Uma2 family endonuclease
VATATKPKPTSQHEPAVSPFKTVRELLDKLGDVPAHRVLMVPLPGTATEDDVLKEGSVKRFCELVDGVLVEKVMGFDESRLACLLISFLVSFVTQRDLGVVAGEGGLTRLFPGQVRIPDVAFVSKKRFQSRKKRKVAILEFAPDLAVEILGKGNTRREMERKLRDYFAAGTRLVWYIDRKQRTVRVYTRPDRPAVLREDQSLDGGDVLPGFVLPLRELFAELDR